MLLVPLRVVIVSGTLIEATNCRGVAHPGFVVIRTHWSWLRTVVYGNPS